ncbi:metal ABC transporter ATP-binding protein [Erwiniaceae bacterium BAC15a-03b]|uniref:Metal ABC transporter ATP-binding protein n=1 Tax=Winslowiella arboricola TaxID=2978220 RepID=A0A9J6PF34_9GAMM|nr:metal ABC transporter ATP-binding protein [Winslowiella arboricola]MCU5771987.1 metal ABC transporter ATP-binding protein [Winslowiella arboricola]MCU5775986.1 metal ABC transporter ATP-binding protein [Winslowiella arboricola]
MVTLQNLQAGYRRQAVTPVINGHFADGSMTALVGANGSGKSTLLKTLAGLLPPVAGDCQLSQPSAAIGWLPQQSEIERQFPISVFDLVAMGCWQRSGWFGGIGRQLRQEIMQNLQRVRMADFADAQPGTLSGGQLQRVLFARLLMQQASLLLLDEPFTGIDSQTIELLLELLAERHRQGCTLIVVLHDLSMVDAWFPQVLRLHDDKCEWQTRMLSAAPLRQVGSMQ